MILGSTLKTVARMAPGYRIVSPAIARSSLSVCVCKNCSKCILGRSYGCSEKPDGKPQYVCKPVFDRLEVGEHGHAIVAWNGSCDRAEFRKETNTSLVLEG